jgi:hypothetical protein
MMGIEVPETCWAYYKCNKPFSGIYLVFILYAYATMYGQTDIKNNSYWTVCVYRQTCRRSQWPRGLGRGSAAARLLGLWVRIPSEAWMSVSCECCVLSARGRCVGVNTRLEESYRVWCVLVWSWSFYSEEALSHWGRRCGIEKKSIDTQT